MTTEKTFDSMILLLDHITPILEDADSRSLRELLRPKDDGHKADFSTADLLARLFPLMIGKHRNEMYGILGILTGETAEAVKEMPFEKIKDVLKNDNLLKDFFDFFPFLLQMALRV